MVLGASLTDVSARGAARRAVRSRAHQRNPGHRRRRPGRLQLRAPLRHRPQRHDPDHGVGSVVHNLAAIRDQHQQFDDPAQRRPDPRHPAFQRLRLRSTTADHRGARSIHLTDRFALQHSSICYQRASPITMIWRSVRLGARSRARGSTLNATGLGSSLRGSS